MWYILDLLPSLTISPQMDVKKGIDSPELVLEKQNTATVDGLYKALTTGDTKKVTGLLASDLEWWFHGPQNCHHMMRMLTGESPPTDFTFEPRSITAIDDRVIVEGWEGAKVYWVHVWSLKDGFVTQLREYFNTWLTVRELMPRGWVVRNKGSTLWQSQPRDLFRRSLPGLMLAI